MTPDARTRRAHLLAILRANLYTERTEPKPTKRYSIIGDER